MSYHIYTTEGIVLSQRGVKESDRLYSIFTRDLGLVYVRALGARKETSKLKGSLEPFSLATISLVKGKNQWRLTSAHLIESSTSLQKKNRRMFLALARGFSLLEKLVQGEEIHPEFFDAIKNIFLFVKHSETIEKMHEGLEVVFVARMLFYLGYLREEEETKELVEGDLDIPLLKKIEENKKPLIKLINEGIEASNLTHR